ncbi:MAG: YdiU family protein [Sandaracinaceae bacterium]|nr:YdiU family protein [Sandaracinaceae bacterium]
MSIQFENTYARLPERFYARVLPTPVSSPSLLWLNEGLAELLRIDASSLRSESAVQALAGNALFPGSEPIALAYAGHQFGAFVPQLGDGRAILLGEVVGKDGRRYDIQLKGSGPTPFSRGGDGRAALGPVLREALLGEAMHALGIPTTRALAALSTGELVFRERPLPGAILVRVAASHIRIGTFEYFAARGDKEGVAILLDYAIARHYPQLATIPTLGERALAFLECVVKAQARLVAQWMGVGFVHGVMNTDNTSVSGETIDYGPCAFLDGFDPNRTFSSIDRFGRYAYSNQPRIALWNLTRLAESLSLIWEESEVEKARWILGTFPSLFDTHMEEVLRRKLGLGVKRDGDEDLVDDWLRLMAKERVDFTIAFRRLWRALQLGQVEELIYTFNEPREAQKWFERWLNRVGDDAVPIEERKEQMRLSNPAFIPRNHRVEQMIESAMKGDLSLFERLLRVLRRPYDEQPEEAELEIPPGEEQWAYRTFCGT